MLRSSAGNHASPASNQSEPAVRMVPRIKTSTEVALVVVDGVRGTEGVPESGSTCEVRALTGVRGMLKRCGLTGEPGTRFGDPSKTSPSTSSRTTALMAGGVDEDFSPTDRRRSARRNSRLKPCEGGDSDPSASMLLTFWPAPSSPLKKARNSLRVGEGMLPGRAGSVSYLVEPATCDWHSIMAPHRNQQLCCLSQNIYIWDVRVVILFAQAWCKHACICMQCQKWV